MSGFGPEIPINVSVAGNVDTNIKSEFIAQGVNQTLHRVYVNFDCDMKMVTSVKNFSQKVTNQVIIAEHVIVGNIPSSYYNLDGFENESDTMQIIKKGRLGPVLIRSFLGYRWDRFFAVPKNGSVRFHFGTKNNEYQKLLIDSLFFFIKSIVIGLEA